MGEENPTGFVKDGIYIVCVGGIGCDLEGSIRGNGGGLEDGEFGVRQGVVEGGEGVGVVTVGGVHRRGDVQGEGGGREKRGEEVEEQRKEKVGHGREREREAFLSEGSLMGCEKV